MADGVLESAVGLFLEQPDLASNAGPTSTNNAATSNTNNANLNNNASDPVVIPEDDSNDAWQDDVRAPIAPTRQTLLDEEPFFHRTPQKNSFILTW